MIASFSFASTAHVTQWSNNLTQQAEILTRRSNLTPQRAKNTVNDLSLVCAQAAQALFVIYIRDSIALRLNHLRECMKMVRKSL